MTSLPTTPINSSERIILLPAEEVIAPAEVAIGEGSLDLSNLGSPDVDTDPASGSPRNSTVSTPAESSDLAEDVSPVGKLSIESDGVVTSSRQVSKLSRVVNGAMVVTGSATVLGLATTGVSAALTGLATGAVATVAAAVFALAWPIFLGCLALTVLLFAADKLATHLANRNIEKVETPATPAPGTAEEITIESLEEKFDAFSKKLDAEIAKQQPAPMAPPLDSSRGKAIQAVERAVQAKAKVKTVEESGLQVAKAMADLEAAKMAAQVGKTPQLAQALRVAKDRVSTSLIELQKSAAIDIVKIGFEKTIAKITERLQVPTPTISYNDVELKVEDLVLLGIEAPGLSADSQAELQAVLGNGIVDQHLTDLVVKASLDNFKANLKAHGAVAAERTLDEQLAHSGLGEEAIAQVKQKASALIAAANAKMIDELAVQFNIDLVDSGVVIAMLNLENKIVEAKLDRSLVKEKLNEIYAVEANFATLVNSVAQYLIAHSKFEEDHLSELAQQVVQAGVVPFAASLTDQVRPLLKAETVAQANELLATISPKRLELQNGLKAQLEEMLQALKESSFGSRVVAMDTQTTGASGVVNGAKALEQIAQAKYALLKLTTVESNKELEATEEAISNLEMVMRENGGQVPVSTEVLINRDLINKLKLEIGALESMPSAASQASQEMSEEVLAVVTKTTAAGKALEQEQISVATEATLGQKLVRVIPGATKVASLFSSMWGKVATGSNKAAEKAVQLPEPTLTIPSKATPTESKEEIEAEIQAAEDLAPHVGLDELD